MSEPTDNRVDPGKVAVTLYLTPVDAGNLEAMAYAGYRRLRDDCTPEAQALARDLLNHIIDAIQPLLAVRDRRADESAGSSVVVFPTK